MSASVVLRRGGLEESRHRIHVAVVDGEGRLVARAGRPDRVTLMRSAAKPFQALPLVADGVWGHYELGSEELALCCASHGGEPRHVDGVRRILGRIGVPEDALACGPHLPLHEATAHRLLRTGGEPERIHNNCSGKHAGMLALARYRGWPLEGYHRPEHPVQERMRGQVQRSAGLDPDAIRSAVDGCGVVAFALPLLAIARAFGGLVGGADRDEPAERAVVAAMTAHPFLVAGTDRLCTRLMEACGGSMVVKVGAEGVFGVGDRRSGVGIAIKVEDGSRAAAEVGVVAVLERLGLLGTDVREALAAWRPKVVRNTRGEDVAVLESKAELTLL